MPYRYHDSIDVLGMNLTRYDGHYSICQMLRDIFHLKAVDWTIAEEILMWGKTKGIFTKYLLGNMGDLRL